MIRRKMRNKSVGTKTLQGRRQGHASELHTENGAADLGLRSLWCCPMAGGQRVVVGTQQQEHNPDVRFFYRRRVAGHCPCELQKCLGIETRVED